VLGQPRGLGDEEEVALAALLLIVALELAQLLRERLVLDVVKEPLGVGDDRVPLLLRAAGRREGGRDGLSGGLIGGE
jgi:hypothetical protein